MKISEIRKKFKEAGYKIKVKTVDFVDLARKTKTFITILDDEGNQLFGKLFDSYEARNAHWAKHSIAEQIRDEVKKTNPEIIFN